MSIKLTCIACPVGCQLKVNKTDTSGYIVTGHTCQRGEVYAQREITRPARVLTTTVKLNNGLFKRLPVKTDRAIPKEKIFEAMRKIKQQEVDAPVNMGDIIIRNILNTGCNIIATKTCGV
ncbi:MAG: molybdopterin oxidoreductase [Firmicutes bacterium]|nr:molybdopterin oxidoreductase [Bacillota bacterium]